MGAQHRYNQAHRIVTKLRLWSIHPKYLDRIGLLAVWREGILAKRVIEGKTKGYRNHPQLLRFRRYENPVDLIDAYLYQIYLEAERRGYAFNPSKIRRVELNGASKVTSGQLKYEFTHLLRKLMKRDKQKLKELKKIKPNSIEPNPVFSVVDGEAEAWEKGKKSKGNKEENRMRARRDTRTRKGYSDPGPPG